MGQVMLKSLCVKHNDNVGQNHKAAYCKKEKASWNLLFKYARFWCWTPAVPSNPLGHTPLLRGRKALLCGI